MEREKITDRAHGIDLSHWQGKFVYADTWGQIDFAIGKIGEPYMSKDWIDPKFSALWDVGIAQVGIRGLYWYQRSGVPWKQQADKFLEAADKLSPWVHILALDVEKTNNTLNKNFFIDTKNILDYLMENGDERRVIHYTNPDILDNYMFPIFKNDPTYTDWLQKCPLWLAQYPYKPDPNGYPLTPKNRSTWDIWQYTSSGDVIVDGKRKYGSHDLNVYNGTLAEMRVWVGIDAPPVIEEPPDHDDGGDKLYYGKVTAYVLNIRSGPGTNYEVIGQLHSGDTVEAYEKIAQWWHISKANNVAMPANAWVSGDYIQDDTPPATTPAAEPTLDVKLVIGNDIYQAQGVKLVKL